MKNDKFKIAWIAFDDSEIISDYSFRTVKEADDYAESCRFEYDDYVMDENCDDIFKREYRFYDEKTKDTYRTYDIICET